MQEFLVQRQKRVGILDGYFRRERTGLDVAPVLQREQVPPIPQHHTLIQPF